MAAEGTDLRYFYSRVVGRSQGIAAIAASSTKVAERLEPGRYLLHLHEDLSDGGIIWVRQGPFDNVVADNDFPSMPLSAAHRAIEFTVHGGEMLDGVKQPSAWDGIAARAAAAATGTVVITKISRHRG